MLSRVAAPCHRAEEKRKWPPPGALCAPRVSTAAEVDLGRKQAGF